MSYSISSVKMLDFQNLSLNSSLTSSTIYGILLGGHSMLLSFPLMTLPKLQFHHNHKI